MSTWWQRLTGRKAYDTDDALSVIWTEVFGASNKKVNSVRGALEQSPWVSRAVRVLSQSSADVPWTVSDQGGKPLPAEMLRVEQAAGALTWVELLEKTTAQQALFGYAVWYPEMKRITLIDADTVKVTIRLDGSCDYRFNTPVHGIKMENLVTLPNWTYSVSPTGMAELKSCIDAANLEESALELMENILGNGGLLSGILSTDQDLNEEEVKAVRDTFREKYGGRNSGSVGVFGRGLTWSKIGVSPGDFSALDVSKITRQMIAAAFGVPAIYLMDTESVDYANSKTQERMFYQSTIQPRVNRLADRITRFVFPLLGIKGKYGCDWTQVNALQEDKLIRAQVDETNLRAGIVSINEIRERDGLEPMDGGDKPLVSAMLVPLGGFDERPEEELPVEEVPVEETPKGISTKGHSPEARSLIAKAFIAKTAPQERKFASATMKTFNKQAKVVEAWVAAGAKAEPVKAVRELLSDADLVENWHSLFVAFGMQAAEEVAARYDMVVPDGSAILKWIRKQESKQSKLVNDTTADEISKILADLRAEGASIPDMVKATKGYFEGIAYRAERVARTNVVAANNYAALDTYQENGVARKQWLSTDDSVTRGNDPNDDYDHVSADMQEVGINEPFIVTNEELMYPGDSSGSAGNVINCRCTVIPVI
jgi:HK97 family phage portal protein